MALSLTKQIAFTEAAAASTKRLLDVEIDGRAALVLESGLAKHCQSLEALHRTDRELAAAEAEAHPRAAGADLHRIDPIRAEVYRRLQLTSHQRMADAAERQRLRKTSPS